MGWFWLNMPLALLFFGCWAGIPLWLTFTRWHAEVTAKHAEIAAAQGEIAAPAVLAQPAAVVAQQALVVAGIVGQPGR